MTRKKGVIVMWGGGGGVENKIMYPKAISDFFSPRNIVSLAPLGKLKISVKKSILYCFQINSYYSSSHKVPLSKA